MRQRITIAGLAIVTCLLVLAWVASNWVYLDGGASLIATTWRVSYRVWYGQVGLELYHQQTIPAPVPDSGEEQWWGGFGYEYFAGMYSSDQTGFYYYQSHRIILPLWFLIVVIGAYPSIHLARYDLIPWYRRKRAPLEGHCENCGYDLTGNVSGRCPECGKRIGVRQKTRRWWSRRRGL